MKTVGAKIAMGWLATAGLVMTGLMPGRAAEERVALVIGNGAYASGSTLANPANDAQAVSAALESAGFKVTLLKDASLVEMEKGVVAFSREAQGAKAAWFFYAGHGIEVKGTNYLLPVDARLEEEFQIKHKALALDLVLSALEDAGTPLKVVVLDCCRDNPFGRSFKRSGAAGLTAVTSTPEGTLIAFAASPGKTAADGEGNNSPYTTALLEALNLPGREIDQVFKETGALVKKATANAQVPWIHSSFYDSFVLRAGASGDGGTPMKPVPPTPEPSPAPKPAQEVARNDGPLKPFDLGLKPGEKAKADEVTRTPRAFSVGKWPEGLALAGDSLWVAESGQRTLGELNNEGVRVREVKCGRLPVGMVSQDLTVYAAVCTDGLIWRQPPEGSGGKLATTKDYPEAISASGDGVYVLMSKDGSSADSLVLRARENGETKRSASMGANPQDIAATPGGIWLLHQPFENEAPSAVLSRLNPVTLAREGTFPIGGAYSRLAVTQDHVFVAGGHYEGVSGDILRCDLATGEISDGAVVGDCPLQGVVPVGGLLVTVNRKGVIHVLLGENLVLQRTIRLDVGEFDPRDIVATVEAIYVSVHQIDGPGVVYKVTDWLPEGSVVEDLVFRLMKADAIGGVRMDMPGAEVKQLFGEPGKEEKDLPNEVEGGFTTIWEYPGEKLRVSLHSDEKGGPQVVDSIHIDSGSSLKTSGGIGIGATLEQVRLVYGGFEDTMELPVPDDTSEPFTFIAGSLYGGVLFEFAEGKVRSILIGAGAE